MEQEKIKCPVCGGTDFDEMYYACQLCGWEDDPVQEDDPDYRGGANSMSLNEARAAWEAKK